MRYVEIKQSMLDEEYPKMDYVHICGIYNLVAVFRKRDIRKLIDELEKVVVRKKRKEIK